MIRAPHTVQWDEAEGEGNQRVEHSRGVEQEEEEAGLTEGIVYLLASKRDSRMSRRRNGIIICYTFLYNLDKLFCVFYLILFC